MSEYLTIKEASEWATQYLQKSVTPSNISYLIQYGRITKIGNNGGTLINKKELLTYYETFNGKRELDWKNKLGEDLNWALSFDYLKESDTTKHVHRLHPYKGKFIPQLVEYFLDKHIDEFKKEVYFQQGDIILDPFAGSGTTLVQANELGMHALGIDISAFNAFIGNCKLTQYNLLELQKAAAEITNELKEYLINTHIIEFEEKLLEELNKYNSQYFPVPDYKIWLKNKEVNEQEYGIKYEKKIQITYNKLVETYKIKLLQNDQTTFLGKWYLQNVREETDFVFSLIKKQKHIEIKKILSLILSRTIRSCRATTHSDLATLKEPVISPYYCSKHGKICKPLFSILRWWETYSKDTIKRLYDFNKIRTNTYQICLSGDSRSMDIFSEVSQKNKDFADFVREKKIKGIFSSPPYVGLIDYHEQHAYAYDLFGFERKDNLEIGSLKLGQGKDAKTAYMEGISDTLINCRKYMVDDFEVFLVANDKYNLYPSIAERAGMKIVNQFKRPVLNRTEKDKGAYSEIIFHIKNK